jgi:Zn-dependent protease
MLLLSAKFLGGTPFIFGWAKPVPVNFGNLRNPKRDMFWVAGAGPAANFVMAIAWGLLLKDTAPEAALASDGLHEMANIGVMINLMLMALNLLPILPLDGGRIAVSLLPHSLAVSYARLEPYGFMVVVLLLATGILSDLMRPILRLAEYALAALLGL